MTIQINHPTNPAPDEAQTWTTEELQRDFTVVSFLYGLVAVIRKSDGQPGTIEFNGMPRVYHSFTEG